MDTSEQYANMCQKATGIQQLRRMESYIDITEKDYYITALGSDLPTTWLPRQDQLQEIVHTCCTNPMCLLIDFFNYCRELPNPAPEGTDSMEQLWLLFTMKTIYSKEEWDGD